MKISKQFRFEASHQIQNHLGKCANLHGHSWILTVTVEGPLFLETGMVMDFFDIKSCVQPLVNFLDHSHLGSGIHNMSHVAPSQHLITMGIPDLPTSENLLWWLADQLSHSQPKFTWSCLELCETCTSSAQLTHSEWAERREATHGQAEERQEDGEEGNAQEAQQEEVTLAPPARRAPQSSSTLEITDDDIPF